MSGEVEKDGSWESRKVELDPELDPWEQQAGESDACYTAFRAYLRLPRKPRKLSHLMRRDGEWALDRAHRGGLLGAGPGGLDLNVVDSLSWSRRQLSDVAGLWRWVERADAFDRCRDEELDRDLVDGRREVASAQVGLLRDLTARTWEAVSVRDLSAMSDRNFVEFVRTVLAAGAMWVGRGDGLGGVGGRFVEDGLGGAGVSVGVLDERLEGVLEELARRESGGRVVEGEVVEGGSGGGLGGGSGGSGLLCVGGFRGGFVGFE